ncbi:MAG: fimbrillin family protein [Bacteroidales bacterium]|nr:fimbrillin family protein [Bacteroidales bacterium]
MKKLILLTCAAAAVALVSCNKTGFSGPEVSKEGKPLSFRVAVNNITKTKGDVYTWTDDHSSTLGIAYMATEYDYVKGVTKPTLFGDMSNDETYDYLIKKSDNSWYFKGNDSYRFPLGGYSRLDVLAIADYNKDTPNGGPKTESLKKFLTNSTPSDNKWNPYFHEAHNYLARYVEFLDVDTWTNQVDLMYAAANDLNPKNNTGKLLFRHAQAALIFNVRFVDEVPENLRLNNILFLDLSNNSSLEAEINKVENRENDNGSVSTINNSDIYLKTMGTFVVDNRYNALKAEWKNLHTQTGNGFFYLKQGVGLEAGNYTFNPMVSSQDDCIKPGKEFMWAEYGYLKDCTTPTINNDTWYQFGEVLLVPEQKANNFQLYYTTGWDNHIYEVNIPRGYWLAGHKYIYNLSIKVNGPKFDVSVEEYKTGYDYMADI